MMRYLHLYRGRAPPIPDGYSQVLKSAQSALARPSGGQAINK